MRSMVWPVLIALATALLAGCLDEEPVVDDVAAPPPAAPPVARVPVDVEGSAGQGACLLVCFSGSERTDIGLGDNVSLTGMDLVVTYDEAVRDAPVLRATAVCSEGERACPAGLLASAEGTPPLRLNATGLDVPAGASMRIDVEVVDDLRPDSFFERFQVQGFLLVIDHGPRATPETCYEDGHDGHEHAETPCDPCPADGTEGEHDGEPHDGTDNKTDNGTQNGTDNKTDNGTQNGTGPDDAPECEKENDRDPDFLRRRLLV